MSQHWAQRASRANIAWLRNAIQNQETELLSLPKIQSVALTQRGISYEKLLDYLQALEVEGLVQIDLERRLIYRKVEVNVYQPFSESK